MTSIPASSSFDTALMTAKAQKAQPQNIKQIEAASRDFEAMFVSEMVSCMFEGVETDPMFGGGNGEEMFKSLLINEYGKLISQGPGIGITSEVKRAMIEIQQKQQGL